MREPARTSQAETDQPSRIAWLAPATGFDFRRWQHDAKASSRGWLRPPGLVTIFWGERTQGPAKEVGAFRATGHTTFVLPSSVRVIPVVEPPARMPSDRRLSKSSPRVRARSSARNGAAQSRADFIPFEARLLKPVSKGPPVTWLFLILPRDASLQLPSRGLNSVAGTLAGCSFQATLEPDGDGGHWLRVEPELVTAARLRSGDVVAVEITPLAEEPEPRVPDEVQQALAAASAEVRAAWADITPMARRDWIHWITSAKKAETRQKRLNTACDMLAQGKRRPCCFDRSGMYSQSLRAPEAEPEPGN